VTLGFKAALHRGRTKLATAPGPSKPFRAVDPELTRVMKLYVDRFNRRDWDGVRELISADARLTVAGDDRFRGVESHPLRPGDAKFGNSKSPVLKNILEQRKQAKERPAPRR